MYEKERELFSELISIITKLRGPQGCQWDKKQTLDSMIPNIIEEAQEVQEAVEKEDYSNLCEELGDLLMDVLMEIQIAREAGLFDYQQVLTGAKEKFIRRHPHVFGDVKVNTPEEALLVWKNMKKKEKESYFSQDDK
ncbi:MAG: MazG nucleotide pyrophosphohydrolase domain-containing protein [Candidatus Caldatribacteriota bacterium]|jgi:MazG family protein|nr:MazG nucleotide pyrophosphohydrolase domain-containing protein [Atribacterota bacterium]MDD3031273.1 MazG nucleotide pyrophosphohydrolase domain-containing protein [Atribacterota bacterium]MDD3640944.1 MazG nucleotide pyrophosphohydrolase domain-containing protein [Atribacterota bacterium]MDD4288338.1 MazG nucleotide pyrophosphohydrolase domain-containing protein [Atribacterota bacterium]MDD4764569.1 MazG nucleotide pyrophosphohydrolase domain-containing protein [Atribacterota bacterium]